MTQSDHFEQLKNVTMDTVTEMIKEDLERKLTEEPKGREGNTIIVKESSSLLLVLLYLLDMQGGDHLSKPFGRQDQSTENDHSAPTEEEINKLLEQLAHIKKINEQLYKEMVKI